jgi:hypothetical protein
MLIVRANLENPNRTVIDHLSDVEIVGLRHRAYGPNPKIGDLLP